MQAPSSLARASVPYLPPSSSNTRPGRAPDGAIASLQVLRFRIGAVQGLSLAHVSFLFSFVNTLGKDSAAEAAVLLRAKSLRSEGASIQRRCSARAVDSVCVHRLGTEGYVKCCFSVNYGYFGSEPAS